MRSTPMTPGESRLDAAFRFGHFLGLTGAQVFAALREVDQIAVMARGVLEQP